MLFEVVVELFSICVLMIMILYGDKFVGGEMISYCWRFDLEIGIDFGFVFCWFGSIFKILVLIN